VFKTTRIAAVLGFAFACVPAHALSMKDYEAKSDAGKLRYLQTCVGNLIIDVAKTDRPLSLKIRSYYYDKLPGYPYPEGTYELLDRIGKLEQQADKDKNFDLSKIMIEELVVLTTAAKFKISVPADFQRTGEPPVAPRPAAPGTAPPTAVSPPSVARPPQRPRLAPIMVGKTDVSHLAGVQWGDTREHISSIFGPPTSNPEQDSSGFGGYPHRRSDGLSIRVNYDDNAVTSVKAYSKGSGVADPLLDLLGKSESAAVALLGPPKTRESLLTIDDTDLVWSFTVAGRPADQRPEPQSIQTLTLHFKTGVGCESVSVVW
jgi:hypothetical protein